jgi:hypothetical protein
MKKFLAIALIGAAVLSSSTTALAANNVSRMATTKGGQKVAECARNMDKGVSECVKMTDCHME